MNLHRLRTIREPNIVEKDFIYSSDKLTDMIGSVMGIKQHKWKHEGANVKSEYSQVSFVKPNVQTNPNINGREY